MASPQVGSPQKAAIEKVFDVGVGRYDVTISIGPSYQSRKDQAFAGMLDFLKVLPTAAPFIGDLVARSSNMPGAKEIADRLKKMLPPQLQDGDQNDPATQISQLQAQHAQMAQELQLCTQALQEAKQELATKKIETDGKIQIARMQEETKILVAEITTKAQNAMARAKLEADAFQKLHVAAHEVGQQHVEHAHEHALADKQHDQAMQQQESQQEAAQAQQIGQQVHEQGMAAQQDTSSQE